MKEKKLRELFYRLGKLEYEWTAGYWDPLEYLYERNKLVEEIRKLRLGRC